LKKQKKKKLLMYIRIKNREKKKMSCGVIYRTARLADDVDDELAVEPRDEARCCR